MQKTKKTEKQLINNVIGQLNGISRMLDDEKDCFAILTQLKAARATINKLVAKFLQLNLDRCIINGKRSKTEYERLVQELSKQL